MEDQIREAISLLRENGYAVNKMSKDMIKDMEECDESGGEKDCSECSCSICVIQ